MNRLLSMGNKIVAYVDSKKYIGDVIVAVMLAFVPIFQHYLGIVDCGSTTILVLLLPYLGIRLLSTLSTFRFSNLNFALVLIVFFVYKMIDHGTYFTEVAQVVLITFFMVCACQSCIDTDALKRAAICIAVMASVCLIIQYFCYYILGFHLQLVPTSALLPESSTWIPGVQTGTIDVTGKVSKIYRPSAFFLEPSHFFLYAFPSLFITLFSPKGGKYNRIFAILITIGLILSTSGMGIAVAVGAWGLYLALRDAEEGEFHLRNMFRRRNLIFIGCFLVVVVLTFAFVPFVRESIVRIFNNPGGSTAVSGRTKLALSALKKMSFGQWIVGIADTTTHLSFNMPGFMATVYKYGIIGVLLSYEIYVKGLFKLNMPYFWLTVVLLIVSFFSAHTHGTFFMLFYVLLLKEGYNVSDKAWIRGDK